MPLSILSPGVNPQQKQDSAPVMPPVSLDTLLDGKLWDRAKAHIETSIAEGTFKAEDLQKALKAGADLSRIDLSDLTRGELDGLTLEGGSLAKAQLPDMQSTRFKNVDLSGAQFFQCTLNDVRFKDCPLDHMRMQDSTLDDVVFAGTTTMNQADIFTSTATNVRFDLKSMKGCKLFDTTLEKVSFNKQNMLGISIITVHFKECDLRGADLRACDIVKGSIDEATKLEGSMVTGRERKPEELDLLARGAVMAPIAGLRDKVPEEAWSNFAARAGNAIPHLRKEIAALAKELLPELEEGSTIDGSGRSIIQIEQIPDLLPNQRLPHFSHANTVRDRILSTGESGGLATAVQHSLIDLSSDHEGLIIPKDRTGRILLVQDSKEHLDSIVKTFVSQLTTHTAARLGEIAERQERSETKADAIVIAMGISPARIYQELSDAIDPQSHSHIAEAVFGKNSESLSDTQRKQAIVDYVDTFFDGEKTPDVAVAEAKLDKEVDRLWEQGTLVVISAGNDRMILEGFEGEAPEGTLRYSRPPELNLLARGKVLSVAASENAATPENLRDDIPAPFSSRGDGKAHPALSAGGQSVLIGYEIADGTSFSAPFAGSVITLMRQVNPALSADEVKSILSTTAYDNPATDAATEGTGQMDVIKALREAARLAQ